MASRKQFIPLESNPSVFTELIHTLGTSRNLAFHDVLSLTEPPLLSLLPRPVLAYVLTTPHDAATTGPRKEASDASQNVQASDGASDDVVWFQQTIGNACGLHAALHAICNGEAAQQQHIEPASHLAHLLTTCRPLSREARAAALEADAALAAAHAAVAVKGDTAAPAADSHPPSAFSCVVPCGPRRRLYYLEGARRGPIALGVELGAGEDMACEEALQAVRDVVKRESSDGAGVNVLALAPVQGAEGG
ncbi:ubiquitin carboxyl-terminal hydrolase, family 1 [Xylariomycetidae sp. FL0641]|nr:ubiquitin carboxyl-terminal hydrolase, family 1 [Xylariomycetidae sp. FL0641]